MGERQAPDSTAIQGRITTCNHYSCDVLQPYCAKGHQLARMGDAVDAGCVRREGAVPKWGCSDRDDSGQCARDAEADRVADAISARSFKGDREGAP